MANQFNLTPTIIGIIVIFAAGALLGSFLRCTLSECSAEPQYITKIEWQMSDDCVKDFDKLLDQSNLNSFCRSKGFTVGYINIFTESIVCETKTEDGVRTSKDFKFDLDIF